MGHFRDAARAGQPANRFLVSCAVRTIKAQLAVPPNADNALREARAALAEGHLDDALEHCQEALRKDPKSALAFFLLGMIQMRKGNESDARQAFIQSLNLDPAHSATHYYLGRIYLRASELRAATDEFTAAIKAGRRFGRWTLRTGVGLARGITLCRGNSSSARLRSTATHRTRNAFSRSWEPSCSLSRWTKLGATLRQIRERFPRDATLAYRIGKALLEYNLPDDAQREFERASRLIAETSHNSPPTGVDVTALYLQMARLRFDRHDYWGTLHAFDKITMNSVAANLRASALHLEGQALVGIGKAREALEKLREATQTNPANPEYFVHLTWAQLLSGDTKSAETTVQLAGNRWPNVPDVQLMQSMVKRESAAGRASVPLSQAWHVKGEGLVCCPCKTPCPCRSNAAPTHKHCENTGLIHIHRGHYGTGLSRRF